MISSGSPGSKLVALMQEQARAQLPIGIELGTVIVTLPDLQIKLDHMPVPLQKADLIVCEYLLRHERIVSIEHEDEIERDLGDKTVEATASGEAIIASKVNQYSPLESTYKWMLGNHKYLKVKFDDVFKVGDRVAVLALPGAQKYLVFDRVVDMSG